MAEGFPVGFLAALERFIELGPFSYHKLFYTDLGIFYKTTTPIDLARLASS